MREASFILPLADNHGHAIEWLHEEMVTVISLRFGGCTMTDVTGAWTYEGKFYLEKGRRYTVALAEDKDDAALLEIASRYAKRAAQKALYYVSRHGRVMLIDFNKGN